MLSTRPGPEIEIKVPRRLEYPPELDVRYARSFGFGAVLNIMNLYCCEVNPPPPSLITSRLTLTSKCFWKYRVSSFPSVKAEPCNQRMPSNQGKRFHARTTVTFGSILPTLCIGNNYMTQLVIQIVCISMIIVILQVQFRLLRGSGSRDLDSHYRIHPSVRCNHYIVTHRLCLTENSKLSYPSNHEPSERLVVG